jgi:hypothetical protein
VGRDDLVLHEISRVLKEGGTLCLTAPMQKRYFGFDDEFVGHYRRYEIPELRTFLRDKGLVEIRVFPVMGRLEKLIMENITRLFAFKKRGEEHVQLLGWGARLAAWVLFPFYTAVNIFLGFLVDRQAKSTPLEQAVNLCFLCRKNS